VTWNCRVCVGVAFLCLQCAFLPSFTTLERADQLHFAKTKMYISLLSNYNAIIAITSYCCVILQMLMLHNAIKTIQNGAFVLFWNLFFFKNWIWNNRRVGFKKTFFSQPWLSFNFFCDFPLIALSGTSHFTISLIGCAPYT